jgi:hypothetical protein
MNAGTAQQYARWIEVLYVITIVAGGFGESHVPNTLLIANDLAGTAHRRPVRWEPFGPALPRTSSKPPATLRSTCCSMRCYAREP